MIYDICPGDLSQCPSADRVSHGFLLSGNEFITTDVPGALFTAARAINDAGEIVGLFRKADGVTHGFLLSDDESISIDFPGAAATMAFGISRSGNVLGAPAILRHVRSPATGMVSYCAGTNEMAEEHRLNFDIQEENVRREIYQLRVLVECGAKRLRPKANPRTEEERTFS